MASRKKRTKKERRTNKVHSISTITRAMKRMQSEKCLRCGIASRMWVVSALLLLTITINNVNAEGNGHYQTDGHTDDSQVEILFVIGKCVFYFLFFNLNSQLQFSWFIYSTQLYITVLTVFTIFTIFIISH